MRYSKYFISILFLLVSVSSFSKDRRVDKSSKKTPTWVGSVAKDYIILSTTAPTLEKAQKSIMESVKQDIINSIAMNITSAEQSSRSTNTQSVQTFKGSNSVNSSESSYASQINTNAAVLPFINGITLTNADGIYWEKFYVKSTKSYYYEFHIKYPFSSTERQRLADEFMKLDSEKVRKFTVLSDNYDTFESINYITTAIGELGALNEYFFDQTRKSEVTLLQKKYQMLFKQIELVPLSTKLGEYKYGLFIGNRQVTYSRLPKVKSSTAAEVVVKRGDDMSYIITYNSEYCNEYEENSIDIIYSFGGSALRESFTFDVRESKIDILPEDIIYIRYSVEDSLATGAIDFTIFSKYDNKISITELAIIVPEFQDKIKSSDTFELQGKGTHKFSFTFSAILSGNTTKVDFTKGWLKAINVATDGQETISLNRPYQIDIAQ